MCVNLPSENLNWLLSLLYLTRILYLWSDQHTKDAQWSICMLSDTTDIINIYVLLHFFQASYIIYNLPFTYHSRDMFFYIFSIHSIY